MYLNLDNLHTVCVVVSSIPSVVLLILSLVITVTPVVLLVLAEVESMMDVKDTTPVVGVAIEFDMLLVVTWILPIQEYHI